MVWAREKGHAVTSVLVSEIPEKRRAGQLNLRWKDACKGDMTTTVPREERLNKQGTSRKRVNSYTDDLR